MVQEVCLDQLVQLAKEDLEVSVDLQDHRDLLENLEHQEAEVCQDLMVPLDQKDKLETEVW